jgi:ribosomal protein L37E
MGLFKRLFQREEPVEIVCQRCGVPAPPNSIECAACGWDLRESYHGEVGAGSAAG